jgi:hypothetical protein
VELSLFYGFNDSREEMHLYFNRILNRKELMDLFSKLKVSFKDNIRMLLPSLVTIKLI